MQLRHRSHAVGTIATTNNNTTTILHSTTTSNNGKCHSTPILLSPSEQLRQISDDEEGNENNMKRNDHETTSTRYWKSIGSLFSYFWMKRDGPSDGCFYRYYARWIITATPNFVKYINLRMSSYHNHGQRLNIHRIFLFVSLVMTIIILWNEGPIGIYVDDTLRHQYYQHVRQQQRNAFRHYHHSLYPDVTIKATRKIERSHYSYYLYEILHHYTQQQQSDGVTTSSNDHQQQKRKKGPSQSKRITAPSSSSTTSVQITGFPDQRHHTDLSDDDKSIFLLNRWQHWLCNRCLRTAYYGSYYNCTYVCSLQYVKETYVPKSLQNQYIDDVTPSSSIRVSYHSIDTHHISTSKITIPHVIHQAGNDVITTLENPILARIQNTYRSMTGYEHHYYTHTLQLQFIQQHYPPEVLHLYELINDIEQRHSMFQLLVLYRMGGIYVNVDVILEVHLDALLGEMDDENDNDDDTASLIVIRHPNILQPHCTYNVLIATIPGHPVIGSMIETTLQSFMSLTSTQTQTWQHYLHDVTSPDEIAHLPIWKLHTGALKSSDYDYGGNCIWGLSINRALQRPLLTNLPVWGRLTTLSRIQLNEKDHNETVQYGQIVILMASPEDTGATRITDLNHNRLIASTNVVGVPLP